MLPTLGARTAGDDDCEDGVEKVGHTLDDRDGELSAASVVGGQEEPVRDGGEARYHERCPLAVVGSGGGATNRQALKKEGEAPEGQELERGVGDDDFGRRASQGRGHDAMASPAATFSRGTRAS